ncbi:hypothetical protein EZV62_021399 [Acer yangbiense]|uniref:Jacalin-type lectin domain-containing protein n=1 Tax=Acer yangbiense TaxID=1000413 RepID=A0A5C7H5L6_9ROSI|nr:hypothetical protein EZV62_021399 [Acer yangbiense]
MGKSCNWENSITLGPCSNRPAGDHEWSFKPNGGITEIKLRRGGVLIESITFKSIDEKGNIETSNKFGGDAGGTEHVISLNWPEEYLMKVSGTVVTYADFPGIGSLCFETNLKKYGPFGHTDGTPFEFSVKDGVIAGFYGRFGIYVNTIGVYVKRSAELFTPSSQVQTVTPKLLFVDTLVSVVGVATHRHLHRLQRLPAVPMSPSATVEVTRAPLPQFVLISSFSWLFPHLGFQPKACFDLVFKLKLAYVFAILSLQGDVTISNMHMSYNWKNYITIEPRGGEGGNKKWSFKPNGGITEIKIGYAAVIDSISFKSVDENGMITSSEKFGGNVWKNEEIILINWPKEYLMKISGTQRTYANVYCIESLCFHTNLNKYGPFGPSNSTPFELCMKDGVIVGFHGCCGIYIDAIGVYVKNYADLFSPPCQVQKMIPQDMSYNWNNSITVGPWGGEGGNKIWSFKPNGGIREIKIGFVKTIDSISFKGVDENGMYTSSEIFGGHGEKTEKTIVLNWPEEYLTKISGNLKTQYEKAYCIESLCFHTNLNKYGPFGPTNGTPFELCMKDGVIVGFHGRSGVYINAIGVYVKNSADLFGPSSQVQILTPQVNTRKMMNMDTPRELGPWGGNDTAKPWDDGVFLDINQVDVHVKKGILLGIQFRYQTKNGNSIESERHGEKSGDALYRIKLDSSSEYLIGIMGYYRPVEGNGGFKAVCSLSFYTNKGKYGPFGDQIGMFFSSSVTNGKIIGFHGRSGDYLDALGVHMEYS